MQGLFVTTVMFLPGGDVDFSPDASSLIDTLITNAMEGSVALASSCPRLLTMRSFVPFYPSRPVVQSVAQLIR